jgi:hypothetical protein
LFGSLLGGVLESFSLWFGLKSLTILAAVLYLLSAIFLYAEGTGKRDVTGVQRSTTPEVLS